MDKISDSEPPGGNFQSASFSMNRHEAGESAARCTGDATLQRRQHVGYRPDARLPTALNRVPVVVLYSQSQPLQRGQPIDILSDEETTWVAHKVARALQRCALEVHLVPITDDLEETLTRFNPGRHLIFNLCESLGGRSLSEAEAAECIAAQGFVYTGCSPETISLTSNKIRTKKLLLKHGLPTPGYQVVQHMNGRNISVPLPAIVKPSVESGSVGITQQSLARDANAVWDRVESCLRLYRQPVLVEQYIPGREINVAIWGVDRPEILPLYEIDFRWTSDPFQRIVSFDSKWVAGSIEYRGTPGICPAALSHREARSIRAAALRAYDLLGIRSYARIDIRLHKGVPFILEVNSNPDLAPNAGFFKSAKAAGYSYPAMVRKIAQLALNSQL